MAQSIGSFQFDNLVMGKVPFVFINLGIDTTKVYPHIYKMHLDRVTFALPEGEIAKATPEQIVEAFKEQHKVDETAVVILCRDGVRSGKIADLLEAANYKNVFFVRGGWDLFMAERG